MAFKSSADVINGEYGQWVYDRKSKSVVFEPLGKAVSIDSITENIETNAVRLRLSFDYLGDTKYMEIPRKTLSDPALLQDLADAGADVTKKHFNVFVDSLRLQELYMEANGIGTEKVFEHLGWKTVPVTNSAGTTTNTLCFRASSMLGPCKGSYIGNLKVAPMGKFDVWKNMVEKEIVGHIPAEIVMLASLSALVNGLISSSTTGENPIWHLTGPSGTGKSALAAAGASAYGEPFDGERRVYDKNGTPSSLQSVYGSWSATENATLGRCAGNRGYLIVMNELGKFKGSDMTSIVYNLSEGTDKARMTKELKTHQAEGYSTTILSVGEHSLLDRCHSKADGLRVRVLELDTPLTTSAENADRIKAVCRKNNGWAAPMMAEYILQNGGAKMVLHIYDHYREDLLKIWPDTPSRERFVSKFPALILTTAELARNALGIVFSEQAIIDFFLERELISGDARNSAAGSYDFILEQCRINQQKFIVRFDKSVSDKRTYQNPLSIPKAECWGRVTNMVKPFDKTRVIVQELEVHQGIVERLLRENGFDNKKTCIEAWKSADLLDYEGDMHPCRKRKLDVTAPEGTNDRVYVFRVFCDPEDVETHLAAFKQQQKQHEKTESKILAMKKRKNLMNEVGDDGGDTDDADAS